MEVFYKIQSPIKLSLMNMIEWLKSFPKYFDTFFRFVIYIFLLKIYNFIISFFAYDIFLMIYIIIFFMEVFMVKNPYGYVFPFTPELHSPLISLISVGVETRSGAEYYYDNKNRLLGGYLFQYTLGGSGILCINDKEYEIQPNQAFLIPIPSDTRYYCNIKKRDEWDLMYMLIQSDYIDEYYQLITKKAGNIFTLDENSVPIQFLNEIINQAKNMHITNFNTASSIAFDFINRLYFHFRDNNEMYTKRNREIIHYMTEHFSTVDSIENIAELYGISSSHLSRDFANDTGMSPIKFLTKLRIEHAKKLLQTTLLPISEIAEQCGYKQTNYFCKIFKDTVGQTPLQYRNLC